MRQRIGIKPITIIRMEIDIVDAQSACAGAHIEAAALVEKYGDIKAVEKEISKIKSPRSTGIRDFNHKEEILWAAKWLLSMKSIPAT